MKLIPKQLVTKGVEKSLSIAKEAKMTDENKPNQGNDNSSEPPPPEVVELDPTIIQKGEKPEFSRIIEIIQDIEKK